jgi:hypothetical protein
MRQPSGAETIMKTMLDPDQCKGSRYARDCSIEQRSGSCTATRSFAAQCDHFNRRSSGLNYGQCLIGSLSAIAL